MDSRPQILCVDDEPRVVEGLALVLRKEYEVHIATSAEQAFQKLNNLPDLAVVISDMRMPRIDGATFFQQLLRRRPSTTRIMLTGDAAREATIRAVNEGQIFRLLSKPCPTDQLKAAIEAGVAQYRLASAERNVLQETLLGCIGALMEVLALANPVAFGRAGQIKRRVKALSARLGIENFWQLEAAALLSQLGHVSLTAEVAEKLHDGKPLSLSERAKVDAVPDVASKLLEHIPRLEPVIQILVALKWEDARVKALGDGTIGMATRILGLVLEYDELIAQGQGHDRVCEHLCGRVARYGPKLVAQLDACIESARKDEQNLDVPLRDVRPGMTLRDEIRMRDGALLVPRGFQVTAKFLERIADIDPELLELRVHVNLLKDES